VPAHQSLLLRPWWGLAGASIVAHAGARDQIYSGPVSTTSKPMQSWFLYSSGLW
jgi:hypothetical protein